MCVELLGELQEKIIALDTGICTQILMQGPDGLGEEAKREMDLDSALMQALTTGKEALVSYKGRRAVPEKKKKSKPVSQKSEVATPPRSPKKRPAFPVCSDMSDDDMPDSPVKTGVAEISVPTIPMARSVMPVVNDKDLENEVFEYLKAGKEFRVCKYRSVERTHKYILALDDNISGLSLAECPQAKRILSLGGYIVGARALIKIVKDARELSDDADQIRIFVTSKCMSLKKHAEFQEPVAEHGLFCVAETFQTLYCSPTVA